MQRELYFTKKKKLNYKIKVVLTANRKKVEIYSESLSTIDAMSSIIHEILRFENLFEGLFFSLISFTADEKDYTKEIQQKQLDYYKSQKQYAYIPIAFENQQYKKLYTKLLKVEKKNKIIHPVFLYSTYLEGMPVDIRMALLLETFEPIAVDLHNRGIITLVKIGRASCRDRVFCWV